MSAPKRTSAWFFHGPCGTTRQDIWRWWEQRRLRFNRDLLMVGLASLLLVVFAGSAAVETGEDFEEPLMMLFGPPIYAILANLAYTLGPLYDTALDYRGYPRKGNFMAGYILSVALTAAPGSWAVLAWLLVAVTGRKL